MQRIILALVAFFIASTLASAWAQDCSQLKPDRSVDTEMRNKTKADANVLLKSLGSGTLDNDYSRMVRNQPFNDIDEMHRWDSFIYTVCSILATSTLSPDDKIDRLEKLYLLKQQGPPGPLASTSINPTSSSTKPTPVPHPASPDAQAVFRCSGKDGKNFSQQICNQMESYRDQLEKLAAQIGSLGINVIVNSNQTQSSFFAGDSISNAATFDAHWVGVQRPDNVIALSDRETGSAWNAAKEFVYRLQGLTTDAHQ